MLKIRLQRTGRKNDPAFRVVVTEHTRGPKSEKHVARVGFYNPKTKEQKLDADEIKKWIANGAQSTGTVHNMLIKAGILKGDTVNVLPQKTPVVTEAPEVAATPEAPKTEEVVAEEAPAIEEAPAEEVAPVEEPKAEAPATEEVKKEEA